MLRVKNLRKEFSQGGGTVVAVKDVSFSVNEGDFVSIVGKSGSGKSTLLGLISSARFTDKRKYWYRWYRHHEVT